MLKVACTVSREPCSFESLRFPRGELCHSCLIPGTPGVVRKHRGRKMTNHTMLKAELMNIK